MEVEELESEYNRYCKLVSESLFTLMFPGTKGRGYIWYLQNEGLDWDSRFRIEEYLENRCRGDDFMLHQFIFEGMDEGLQNLLDDHLCKRRLSPRDRRILSLACVVGLAAFLIRENVIFGEYLRQQFLTDHQETVQALIAEARCQTMREYQFAPITVRFDLMSLYQGHIGQDEEDGQEDPFRIDDYEGNYNFYDY